MTRGIGMTKKQYRSETRGVDISLTVKAKEYDSVEEHRLDVQENGGMLLIYLDVSQEKEVVDFINADKGKAVWYFIEKTDEGYGEINFVFEDDYEGYDIEGMYENQEKWLVLPEESVVEKYEDDRNWY